MVMNVNQLFASTGWQDVLSKSLPDWRQSNKGVNYSKLRSPQDELFGVARMEDSTFVIFRNGLKVRKVPELAKVAQALCAESMKTFDFKDAYVEEEGT
jgi:hypothetical protein